MDYSCIVGQIFQLPPSHEGEQAYITEIVAGSVFQLPPSHEGERVREEHAQPTVQISTPALA